MVCRQACPFNTLEGCKVKEYNAICPMSNSIMPITEYRMTNADWIRSMTEKELAEFIGHNSLCDRVQGEGGNWCNDHNCTDCLEEWLKQPAEIPEDDC